MKKAKITIWNGELLVEYIDASGIESSFIVKDKEDVEELKKELKKAGYIKEQ
jgi:hypothetical protein